MANDLEPQIARFMWPTWGPPGPCRPQVGPALAPWTLLSGTRLRCLYGVGFLCSFPSQSRRNKTTGLLYGNPISQIRCPIQSASPAKRSSVIYQLLKVGCSKNGWQSNGKVYHTANTEYINPTRNGNHVNKHITSKSTKKTLFSRDLRVWALKERTNPPTLISFSPRISHPKNIICSQNIAVKKNHDTELFGRVYVEGLTISVTNCWELIEENAPVPGEFPTQKPVTRSFGVFFDLRLNKRLSEQWWGW